MHEYAWRCHTGAQGVAKDSHQALKYLTAAADKNCAEAQLTLARLLLLGEGVDKDVRKGLTLLRKSAAQGA